VSSNGAAGIDDTVDAVAARAAIERRLRRHGALDVGFALLYAALGLWLFPSRRPGFSEALMALVLLLLVAGASLLLRLRMARTVALVAQGALALFTLVVTALLVASAAYLRGIYGPLGQAAAAISLIVAALVVELCGLLPLFQIPLLLDPAVRRSLGQVPSSGPQAGRRASG
jgi:hypothetical protein